MERKKGELRLKGGRKQNLRVHDTADFREVAFWFSSLLPALSVKFLTC